MCALRAFALVLPCGNYVRLLVRLSIAVMRLVCWIDAAIWCGLSIVVRLLRHRFSARFAGLVRRLFSAPGFLNLQRR